MSDKNDIPEISDETTNLEKIIATHNIISKTHPISLRGTKNSCELELILDKTLNLIIFKIAEENSKNEINRLLITYSDIYLIFNNYFICFNESMEKIFNFFNNCFCLKKYVIKIMNDKKVSLEFLILQDKKSTIKNIIIPPYLTEEDKKEFNKRFKIFQKFETNGSNESKIFIDELIAPQLENVKYMDDKFLLNINLSTLPNIKTMVFTAKLKILEENQIINSDTDSISSTNFHINDNIQNINNNSNNNINNNFIFSNYDNIDNTNGINKKKEIEKIYNAYFTYDDLIEISKNYYSIFANIDDIKDDILINLYNKNYKIEEISEKIIKLFVTTIMYSSSVVNQKDVIFELIQDYKIDNWYQKKMEKYQHLLNECKMKLFVKVNEKKTNSNNNIINENFKNNKKNKKEKNPNSKSDIILPALNNKNSDSQKKAKINVSSNKKKFLSRKRKTVNKLPSPKPNNKNYNIRNNQKDQNSQSETKINDHKILGNKRSKSMIKKWDSFETSNKKKDLNINSYSSSSKKYNLRNRKKNVLNNNENNIKSFKIINNKKINTTKENIKKKKSKKKINNKKKKEENEDDENKKIVEYCEVIDLEESIGEKVEGFKKENIEY